MSRLCLQISTSLQLPDCLTNTAREQIDNFLQLLSIEQRFVTPHSKTNTVRLRVEDDIDEEAMLQSKSA